MSKWKLFHQKYAEPKISAGQAIAERLKTELSIHLTTKKTEQSKPENHPQTLLHEANGSLGKLSRIFEQMDWPMPDYEEISAQIGQVGIRAYTKSLLDDILPTLIDNKGNKLNQKVINAINFAGQGLKPPIKDLYGEYCKRNFEEEIANQFAQALIVGFTQKVLDAEKAKSIMLRETEIAKLTDKFEREVQNVLAASLPKEEEKEKLSQLSQAYQQAIKEQEEADRFRQTRLHEQFNTPMEEIAKITSIRGIQPTLDIDNMEQAQEFMQAFNQLVEHAESLDIAIPGIMDAQRELNIAREVINDADHLFAEMDEKAKVTLIRQKLVTAADKIIDAMNDQLKIQVPNPVENSLWQKFLNFFTTTKEMKIYNKQQELLNKLAQGYDMQHEQKVLLKVEFKEDNIKVNGLESENAKARFLKQLNAGSKVEYSFNKEGSLCKVVSEKSEQLSKEDFAELKNHLKTIDEAPDSSYRIKQIDETPKESVQIKM